LVGLNVNTGWVSFSRKCTRYRKNNTAQLKVIRIY
jgi:hypothetical protein